MPLTLGIDLGTSKVAAVLVDPADQRTVDAVSVLLPPAVTLGERDPAAILDAAREAVRDLHADGRRQVAALAVTGQMHGVVCWDPATDRTGPLVTWQDTRCDASFIAGLRAATGDLRLAPGYGVATLAWYARHDPARLVEFPAAGTIMDYLTARLTAAAAVVTDPTCAASLGCFDLRTRRWHAAALERVGVPPTLLPAVRRTASRAGVLTAAAAAAFDLPAGIPVATPVGDNPASLHATLDEPATELALVIGTGSQLTAVMATPIPADLPPTVEARPYVDDRWLATAVGLCGGRAWLWLADTVAGILTDLDLEAPHHADMFAKLNHLAAHAPATGLRVDPAFGGTRQDPARRGAVTGIGPTNLRLPELARATARGILAELADALPPAFRADRTRLRGSGNALQRNPIFAALCPEVFGLDLELTTRHEEAASGAALLAHHMLTTETA